jgi:hypothetical protein
LADLDGDGEEDMISGSWEGDIWSFRGLGMRAFAEGRIVFRPGKGASGLQVAGGTSLQASAPWATDWDGDGDIDLVVGTIDGHIYLLRNDGTRTAPGFADPVEILAGGKPLNTWLRDSGPCVADWDGDGLRDLVIGDEKTVWWARNIGTAAEPRFSAPEKLLPGGKEFHEGYRFKPCVADWNGDGLPDLIIGTACDEKTDARRARTGGRVWVSLREREPKAK